MINLRPMLDNGGQHAQTLTIDFQATPFPEDWRAVVVLVEVSIQRIRLLLLIGIRLKLMLSESAELSKIL